MARYRIVFERDEGGWWVARVPAVRGCVTQGRTVAEARRRVREALGLFVHGAARASLLDDVRLPSPARRALARLAVAERRAEEARAVAAQARAAAAESLTGPPLRLSVRDAAEVLGISHQRVQQLKRGAGLRGGSTSRAGEADAWGRSSRHARASARSSQSAVGRKSAHGTK